MQTSNDVGTLTIGGASFLAVFEDATWTCDPEFDDWQNPSRFRKGGQAMKNAAKLAVRSKPIKTGQTRVSHFDLSALTLATQNLLPEMENWSFKVQNPINVIPNSGEFMRRYQADPGGTFMADFGLQVADTSSVALALAVLLESDDPADLAAVLSLTLNSVAITVPGHLRRGSHAVQGRQKVSIGWESSDNGGTMPTAPTGTSTMLERACNAPKTALAFTFVSKAVAGLSRTGYVLIESGEISGEPDKIVKEAWNFVVSEPWTTSITAP